MKIIRVITVAVAAAMAFAAPAWAEGDPHVPDGQAGWCPGGQHAEYGGARRCNGVPFADGSFYSQSGHFSATLRFGWDSPTCMYMIPGNSTPAPVIAVDNNSGGRCEGRGRFINTDGTRNW